jgi:hypothetical protein
VIPVLIYVLRAPLHAIPLNHAVVQRATDPVARPLRAPLRGVQRSVQRVQRNALTPGLQRATVGLGNPLKGVPRRPATPTEEETMHLAEVIFDTIVLWLTLAALAIAGWVAAHHRSKRRGGTLDLTGRRVASVPTPSTRKNERLGFELSDRLGDSSPQEARVVNGQDDQHRAWAEESFAMFVAYQVAGYTEEQAMRLMVANGQRSTQVLNTTGLSPEMSEMVAKMTGVLNRDLSEGS